MEESSTARTTSGSLGDAQATPIGRRGFVRRAGAGVLGIGIGSTLPGLTGSGSGTGSHESLTDARSSIGSGDIVDSGAGMYTGNSTAQQMSTATINPREVTCGVGTLGLDATDAEKLVPVLGGLATKLPVTGGSTGPFVMLMYATHVASYKLNRPDGIITATGRMRSITRVADQVIEDAMHDFLAIAKDGRDTSKPHFAIHFKTPFWSPSNPIATPSDAKDGLVMFGGNFLVGTVNVSR